jgi:uncharacterized protein (TIGR03435 family)
MRDRFRVTLMAGVLIVTGTALGQAAAATQTVGATQGAQVTTSNATFDVASVRPSPAPDMQAMIAGLQAGRKPNWVRVDGTHATFHYESLTDLIAYAYKMQQYEISGPEWMVTDRFDIEARLPDGAAKADVPAMLRALLKERFNLETHSEMEDQPVLALVVGKSGPKLQPAAATAEVLDESVPLKPGESMMDTADGRVLVRGTADGSSTTYVGPWGSFTLKFDGDTGTMHMKADSIDMRGFARMMNTLGAGQGRQIVNMTGLTGKYQTAADFSMMDLRSSLHDQGINLPTRPGSGGGSSEATDPEGGATVAAALDKLGLKLEKSRAKVNRLVIDHVEKLPTEN